MSGFNSTALVDLVTSSRKMFPIPVGDATSSTSTLSSSNAQLRKIKKPLIEKRRRERINECLVQLKALVLEAMNKDGSQYSKMEKADILEMTVAHLKSLCASHGRPHQLPTSHATSSSGGSQSPSSLVNAHTTDAASRYVSGYTECAREVASYLAGLGASVGAPSFPQQAQGEVVRRGLLNHLENCLQRQASLPEQQRNAANFSPVSNESSQSEDDFHTAAPSRQWVPAATFEASSVYRRSPAHAMCVSPSIAEMDRLSSVDSDVVSSAGSRLLTSTASSGVECGRSRCDSGVYSGASSPADDSMMSPQSTTSSSPMAEDRAIHHPLSNDCNLSSAARRGCPMPQTFFSSCCGQPEDVARLVAQRQRMSPMTDFNHNVLSFEAPQSHVLNLTTKNDDVWRPW